MSDSNNAHESLKQELSELNSELHELNRTLGEKRKDLVDAENGVARAKKENIQLLNEQLQHGRTITKAEREAKNAQRAAATAQTKLNHITQEVQELEAKKKELETNVAALTQKIDDQATALKEIEDKIADPTLQALQQAAIDAETRKATADTAAKNARGEAAKAIRKARAAAATAINTVKQDCANEATKLQQIQLDCTNEGTKLQDIKNQINSLSGQRKKARWKGRFLALPTIAAYAFWCVLAFVASSFVARMTGSPVLSLGLFVLITCVLALLLERAAGRIPSRLANGGGFNLLLGSVPAVAMLLVLGILGTIFGLLVAVNGTTDISAKGIAQTILDTPPKILDKFGVQVPVQLFNDPSPSEKKETTGATTETASDSAVDAEWINLSAGELEKLTKFLDWYEPGQKLWAHRDHAMSLDSTESDGVITLHKLLEGDPAKEIPGLVPEVQSRLESLKTDLYSRESCVATATLKHIDTIQEHLFLAIRQSGTREALNKSIKNLLGDLLIIKEIRERKSPQ